ncbi:RHS repeat-associated core domain-containing protein [Pseudoalteromonas sp. A3]|uniref:RHS repeat-associated core domain-containing protein n=1 Tax=Pseudoalteromonas sp. A3 TaxID=142792 RepID=UPI0029C9FD5B|nr:RHS repeat-associated core domain-containing protein [Pseudoalteromonas sp. A3]
MLCGQGNIKTQQFGNSITLNQQFDVFNRLTQQQLTHPAQALFDTCTYNYDSVNQLIARKNEGVSSQNINFEYNSLGQLIQQTLASSRADTTTHYQWDSFGNPQSQTVQSNTSDADLRDTGEQGIEHDAASNEHTVSSSIDLTHATHSEYNELAPNSSKNSSNADSVANNESTNNTTINSATDADRLTQFGDSDFYYDEFGNQIRETGKGIKTRREYNAFNQLSCFNNNGTLTQYGYDPLGRRIAKHTEHGKIDYIWDNDQLIGECQHGEYTWYINLQNQFHPVALIKQGEVYYYHLDQLNTPRFVTNNKAQVVWENQADVYGYEEPKAEPDTNKESSFTQPIRFQGQYLDEESGLHYNRYRYYSPKQQRFINQDPIGLVGGINHYQYAPNPVNWVDPFGLMCKEGEASLKQALNNCTQSGVISPELSDKLYLAAQDGNLTPKEIKHGLAALAVAKVAPVQPIVNQTTTNVVRIATQTAANDALYVAERSLLATVAPWLAKAVGTVSLLAYSPSTGGVLEELAAPDGTIYSKHRDEVYYKAVGVDGDEWSTPDPQQDMQFRMWKANGGEGTLEDWLSQGMPETSDGNVPLTEASLDSLNEFLPYTTYEERLAQTPINNGSWSGERGESMFISTNPSVNEVIADYGVEGINYENAYPDFSPVAEVTYTINDIGWESIGTDRTPLHNALDRKLAEDMDLPLKDIKKYRKVNSLTWHEKEDMKTIELVPTIINGKFKHVGGFGEVNAMNGK